MHEIISIELLQIGEFLVMRHVTTHFIRFNPKYVTPTVKHDKGSFVLRACFSLGGFRPLYVIDGIIHSYKNIMEVVMLLLQDRKRLYFPFSER